MNMKNNKICLILPYFGKFNNYFDLWLNSCKYNERIDWHIYTDDHTAFNYPKNVIVHYCLFSDLRKRIQSLFGSDIILAQP